ncbi:multiple sugar transport system permease protein [Paenibacillus sp. 1_12]|uniref:carbohydrate ABC transporter permease n=1 Tax=Paenibacillus sp. 1_12 TaxID=1566278 RepID=UPI0008F1505D|nr:carbohydrate ABC transporter permease [Paenibacillus sp. 1_12]SFL01280.1 multiple sugar transport system permease protein [Paenibacillus sp. 1_12]
MNAKYLKLTQKTILTVIMLVLSIVTILPFIWMLSASFKPTADVFEFPIRWIPKKIIFENYVTVWFARFQTYFLNSVKVSVISVVGEVITSALAGYAFAKIKFKGKEAAFILYIATLMFPHQMLLVPRFVLYRLMGLYNSLWALMLPGIFSAFGTFLFRQFIATIPDELIEAAKMDGCRHFRIFWRIIIPLSLPVISTLVIFSFVGSWNNYENALVFLSNKTLYTIPLGLLQFQSEEQTNYGAIMAASVLSLMPIFLVFLSLQKYFIEGIATSGLKG